jgi:hypothetical protein
MTRTTVEFLLLVLTAPLWLPWSNHLPWFIRSSLLASPSLSTLFKDCKREVRQFDSMEGWQSTQVAQC